MSVAQANTELSSNTYRSVLLHTGGLGFDSQFVQGLFILHHVHSQPTRSKCQVDYDLQSQQVLGRVIQESSFDFRQGAWKFSPTDSGVHPTPLLEALLVPGLRNGGGVSPLSPSPSLRGSKLCTRRLYLLRPTPFIPFKVTVLSKDTWA